MAIKLNEKNGGRVLEVQVSGKLDHADYRQFVPKFEQMVQQHGRIRVLFEMVDPLHGRAATEGAARMAGSAYALEYHIRPRLLQSEGSQTMTRQPRLLRHVQCGPVRS